MPAVDLPAQPTGNRMQLIERIREIRETEWQPVATGGYVAGSAVAAAIAWFANTGEGWVHILDSANLAFHEFGHPLFGLLSERLMVYGGTLTQLVFPVVALVAFWARREALAFALAAVWLGDNLWNIARYMADARDQLLPLVGGGEHDWTEILSRWGALHREKSLAWLVRLLAWGIVIGAWSWVSLKWWRDREAGGE